MASKIDVLGLCNYRNRDYVTTLVVVTERTVFDIVTLESPGSVLRLDVKKEFKKREKYTVFYETRREQEDERHGWFSTTSLVISGRGSCFLSIIG